MHNRKRILKSKIFSKWNLLWDFPKKADWESIISPDVNKINQRWQNTVYRILKKTKHIRWVVFLCFDYLLRTGSSLWISSINFAVLNNLCYLILIFFFYKESLHELRLGVWNGACCLPLIYPWYGQRSTDVSFEVSGFTT